MRVSFFRRRLVPGSALSIALALGGCSGSVDVGVGALPDADSGGSARDATSDDAAMPDAGTADAAPPDAAPPKDCSGTPLAVDPPSTLDPLLDGPLVAAHTTITVPTLGPLTNVKVKIHYPAQADKVTPHPGRHAWVMFHHAVHGPYPGVTYDRYDGIFDRWATHGIVTFSIDGARVFFPPAPCGAGSTPSGGGCYTTQSYAQLQVVAGMMSDAITHVLAEQENDAFPLKCALDKARGGVAGHSRGGGSALLVKTAGRTDGAVIKGYVGFQPVNPEMASGAPSPPLPPSAVPAFDLPALWLESGNDGDVTYPITATLYAHTRNKAALVTILGSKHTYTLDTPLPSQGGTPASVTPDEHKNVCAYFGVPFLRAFVRDAAPAAADLLRVTGPEGASVPDAVSSGDATLRYRPSDAASGWVEKFDEPLGATPTTTAGGDAISLAGSMTAVSYETYSTSIGASAQAQAVSKLLRSVLLNWGAAGGALELAVPSAAFTGKKAIAFDTAFLDSPTVTSGTHPLYLEVTDSAGASVSLALSTLTPASWSKRPRRLATVHIPLTKLVGIDLTKITAIRFVAQAGTANHDILVDLLRLE